MGRQSGSLTKVAALIVAAAAFTATVVAAESPASAKIRRPDLEWDPRIETIAHDVERIRHLEFATPVRARYLTSAQFDGEGSAPFLPAELRGLHREARLLHVLGLLGADERYVRSIRKAGSTSVLAYYYNNAITMRGNPDRVSVQYVLSHELTHGLQDDHFGQFAPRRRPSGEYPPAFAALLEGDADRVAEIWLGEQSDAALARFAREYALQGLAIEDELGDTAVPEILTASSLMPYQYGIYFTQAIVATDGERGLNRKFRHPPRDDAGVLNLLLGKHKPQRVPVPSLIGEDRQVGRATSMGAVEFFHLLASRIDPMDALRAADQWAGDREILFRRSGGDCARATFRGRSAEGTAVITAAVTEWMEVIGAADAVADGFDITTTVCGRPATDPESIRNADLFALARNRIVALSLQRGRTRAQIDCTLSAYFDDGAISAALRREDPATRVLSEETKRLFKDRRDATRAECAI